MTSTIGGVSGSPGVEAAATLQWSSSVGSFAGGLSDGSVNRLSSVTGAISPYTVSGLPTSTLSTAGGTGTVTYSISPALPSGLTFDSSSGVISGTLLAPYGPADHVISATDEDGDIIEISVYFDVTARTELEPQSQRLTLVKGKGFFA
ncbi:MAG: putative Ig domain, partial [Actinomycetota bacterium]